MTSSLRTVEPRLLNAFVAVAREGNVSRAAERLFLSQPAVSLQLKELTSILGMELFVRTPNGMALAREGAALLVQAERALDGLTEFVHSAERLKGKTVRGVLRIGTILDPEFTRLGGFLYELVNLAPDLEPELHHGMSGNVLEMLMAKSIDVGFYLGDAPADLALAQPRKRGSSGVHSKTLTQFTYRVIAPPGWGPQVAGRDWAGLVELPWILTPPQSVHARLLAEVLEPLGLEQRRVAMVDQEASMLAAVRSGIGLSLARESIAIHERQTSGLVLADVVKLETSLSFVCLATARNKPAVDAAWRALKRVWRL